jgi:CubicO group peptidase (beta-lactamase class C family)
MKRAAVVAIVLASVFVAAVYADPLDELAGLWKAKKRYGPDARGTLLVEKTSDGYLADFAGWRVPLRPDGDELAFALPNGDGEFRGKLENGNIRGHWIKAGTPVNDTPTASPVLLNPDGAGRWRGVVAPLSDEFTFYLLLEKRPDGTLGALLRNPERDVGAVQLAADRLTRDGAVVKLIGKRGGAEQEVSSGTYDAEREVLTLVFPTRGATYDFHRDDERSEFYPRGKHPGRYAYHPPPALDDGWPTATLADVGMSRAGIEQFIQFILDMPMEPAGALQIDGMLVVRHGKLVLEEYFHGQNRERLHDTRSAAKSLTAVTIGAAMQAGAPLQLDSRVYDVMNGGAFAQDDARKKTMTLEHLLTMSSGYFCDDTNDQAPGNEEVMTNQTDEPDYYRYTMKVPLATPPGENSVYCSASPNLALGMLGAVTHETPLYTFDRLVAAPMKMTSYSWYLDPAGHPYGGGGVRVLPRDFLKLGQLMLNGGTWEGRRILSREFVARATSRLYHLRNVYYGFLWWSFDYPYKDRVVQAYAALGAGGQTITVIPELDLVVGTWAANYGSGAGTRGAGTNLIPRFILPAVREAGDDPNAPVHEHEYTNTYGPSKDGSRVTPAKP